MGKEWTTVGPDSEIKLVGVSAASTVIVSLCVCVSQGRQGSGAHLPAPRLDFFQKFTFFRKSPTVKKTSWGADTHTRDTWAHTSSRITQNSEEPQSSQDHNSRTIQTHQHTRTTARPHDRAKTESAADSTAAAPEPNAPHGRLPVGTVPAPPESFYRYSTGTVPCVSTRLPPVSLPGLAVESAAVSAVAWSCGGVVGFGWL